MPPLLAQIDPAAPVFLAVGPWTVVIALAAMALVLGATGGGGVALGLFLLGRQVGSALGVIANAMTALTASTERHSGKLDAVGEKLSTLTATVAMADGDRRTGDDRRRGDRRADRRDGDD